MSKVTYVLANNTRNIVALGSIGFLAGNAQQSFIVEEDSPEEEFINKMIAQGVVTKSSAALVSQAYGPTALSPDQIDNFNLGNWKGPSGSIFALSEVTPYVARTTTGAAFTGACEFAGFDCIVAAGNITVYDNTSAAGNIIVPTTALVLGRTEFTWKRYLTLGCWVVLSGAATVNILVG